jgi:cell wall-associated NlpC family hydrolase
MAALVESGMKNLSGGDADSVGLFQMRLGIWNAGDYAGYPERPELQLDWFLDHAEAVKAQRLARGAAVDPAHYGEWIADVERPAEQYRGRYQMRLDDAQGLLSRAVPDGGGIAVAADAGHAIATQAGARATEAVAEATRYIGTPYRWGGSTPQSGFDCSGLVQWAYAKAGIQMPRVTDQQFTAPGGSKVGRDELLPGDLVFFRDASGYIHHVGISLGGDRFVEAPRTGLDVRISSLKDPYYAGEFAGARRFDAPAAADAAGARYRAREMPAVGAE